MWCVVAGATGTAVARCRGHRSPFHWNRTLLQLPGLHACQGGLPQHCQVLQLLAAGAPRLCLPVAAPPWESSSWACTEATPLSVRLDL